MKASNPKHDTRPALPGDLVWTVIRADAEDMVRREPALASFVYATVLSHATLEDAVIYRTAQRLDHPDVPAI